MHASLRALLAGIVDYAGLFPPAKLELDVAIRNYARYQGEDDAWMLGRFICPAGTLSELLPYGPELFTAEKPLRLAVLGRGGAGRKAFFEGLTEDVKAVGAFRPQAEAWARIEAFEVRLPADLCRAADRKAAAEFLVDVERAFTSEGMEPIVPDYYELVVEENWRDAVRAIAAGFSEYCRGGGRAVPTPAGLKLRCGGADAAAVPSAEQVTKFIEVCRDKQLPLKCTAGLHHPVRRFDPCMRTKTHGFLNVFVAGVLAYALPLSHHDIRAVVEETDPRHLHFGDSFLGWNEADASADEVRFARQHRVVSFGSCSFDEPREDLRALGLM